MARGPGGRAHRRLPRACRVRPQPDPAVAGERQAGDRARATWPRVGPGSPSEAVRASRARAAPARPLRLVAATLEAARLSVAGLVPRPPARPSACLTGG